MDTVILAGATGFVGGHLTRALVSNGWRVVALVREGSDRSKLPVSSPALAIRTVEDLASGAVLEDMSKAVACISAVTAYRRGDSGDQNIIQHANIGFPLELLQAALTAGCPAFINFDSFFTKPGLVHDYQPEYTAAKRAFIEHARRCTSNHDTTLFNLVLEHVYGPDDGPQKFIPWLLGALLRNESPLHLTSGEQQRDFVFISDVVDATLAIIRQAKRDRGKVINIPTGTGTSTPVRQFIETARQISRSRSQLLFGSLRSVQREISCSTADTSYLRALGWKPTVDINEGLRRTLDTLG